MYIVVCAKLHSMKRRLPNIYILTIAALMLVFIDTPVEHKVRQLFSDDSILTFHYENNTHVDTTITLINIADYPMDTIRRWAERIFELSPKVVAVDNFSDSMYNIEKTDAKIILPIISEDGKYFEYSKNNITTNQIHGVALIDDYFRMTKYFPSQERLPSFAVQILKEYESNNLSEAFESDKKDLINYLPTSSFNVIDFPDQYPDELLKPHIKDKIVIFGYLGYGSNHIPDILDNHDAHSTPIGRIFGPIIIANQIQTLRGNDITEPGYPTIVLVSLATLILTYLFISKVKSRQKLLVTLGLNLTLIVLLGLASFTSMLILDMYNTFISIELFTLGLVFGFQTGIVSILSTD
jgi:hypothetical protein